MKLWFSAQEIADLDLPDFPSSRFGINKLAERDGWAESTLCRKREGREGGGGLEFHIDLFPLPQRLAYAAAFVRVEQSDYQTETDENLTIRERTTRDARLILVRVADRFRKSSDMQGAVSDELFSRLYADGKVAVSDWIKQAVSKTSRSSLARWRAHARDDKNALGSDPSKARQGTGVLDRAEDGRLRAYCLAVYASNQFFSTKHIRNAALEEFGPSVLVETSTGQKRVPMPPLRTFQNALRTWKNTRRNELLRLTDPDRYKSIVRLSAVGANKVDRLNQVWEIDASPCDAMTTDGRPNIYAAIDLYSRRTVILVTATPRAAGVALLVRQCLVEWGVPEIIKSDNGSDFVAEATKRLLEALGIEQELSTPYSPEQKGTVERVIGTFQRDCAATLPGFVGHSVSDRKVIEARKAFSKRLGTDDAQMFNVELTSADIQEEADRWTTQQYAHSPHSGLKDHTPFEVASSWTGEVRRIDDERALDVLLAPVPGKDGKRRMTKSGIRIDGQHYYTGDVMPGADVLCRHDPSDLGKLWLFAEDGETYLGQAVCPELAGLDPVETIQKVRAQQKATEEHGLADIRKEKRKITPRTVADAQREAYRHNADIVAFPKTAEGHTTAKMDAAGATHRKQAAKPLNEAQSAMMDKLKSLPSGSNVKTLQTAASPQDRFAQARRFEGRLADGEQLSDKDALWLTSYQSSPEYRARKMIETDRQNLKKSVPPAS